MRRAFWMTLAVVAVAVTFGPLVADDSTTVTGEVVDMACYVASGAHGADHADCAEACVKGGQPMGLLTEDGTLYLLAASHDDGEPFEALKELAGSQAKVTGTVSQQGGVNMVTVTASAAAK